jgi:heme exporter protein C
MSLLVNLKQLALVPKRLVDLFQPFLNLGYGVSFVVMMAGINQGLFFVPEDAVQGDAFRIIFFHVPLAVLSLGLYACVGFFSCIFLVWRIKAADLAANACTTTGLLATLLVLVTGSIWAKPTWGTWWVWDARLTSEFMLLCLYLGRVAIRSNVKPEFVAKEYAAWLACLGVLDLPIIHYSVHWWYTLHQGSTLLSFQTPSIAWVYLQPLLICLLGFCLWFACITLDWFCYYQKCAENACQVKSNQIKEKSWGLSI